MLKCFYGCGSPSFCLERTFDVDQARYMNEGQIRATRQICEYYGDMAFDTEQEHQRGDTSKSPRNALKSESCESSTLDVRGAILKRAASHHVHQSTLTALLSQYPELLRDRAFMIEMVRVRPEILNIVRDKEFAEFLAIESVRHDATNYSRLPLDIRVREHIRVLADRLPCGCRVSKNPNAKHAKKCPIWPGQRVSPPQKGLR